MASAAGLELAGNTIAGWFETWSVVPAWEKFEILVKALAAEKDEDWRSLHSTALTADRKRKREERQRKKLGRATTPVSVTPVSVESLATNGQPDLQSSTHDPALAAMSWVVVAPAAQSPAGPLPVPRQLPMDVPRFTGRDAELATLDALLTQDALLTRDEESRPAAMRSR
jgi:hypothetical protein